MKALSVKSLIFLLVGVAVGWALARVQSGTESGGAPLEERALALVGPSGITEGDVESAQSGEFLKLDRQRQTLLEQNLGRAIQIRLVEVEAEERGVSPEELVEAEVDGKVVEPSSEEVEAFFRGRQIQGELEAVAPQIRDFLRQEARNSRYREFLSELEARHTVEVLLEPLRSSVASDGFPARGPEDAPVTIVEFSDFECPYCRQLKENLDRTLDAYGDQVRFVYRHYPVSSIHPNAQKSAEASMCARDQEKFWEMHDAMFADQEALDVASLKETASSLGLDRDRFDTCLDSGQYAGFVARDREVAMTLGLDGTPGLFINGRFLNGVQSAESLGSVIYDELKRGGYSGEPRLVEPLRVEVAADGFPAKGPPDAPVTIVEFSDFQCPYCTQLLPALEQVLEEYGDRVRLVFRQFPLASIHPMAQKAAEASLCADEQGRFWEMHDALFADQDALSIGALKETARSLALDGEDFDECLDSGRFEARVLADLEAGRRAGVTGTPGLFINGRRGSGVQRFETLAAIIDQELEFATGG